MLFRRFFSRIKNMKKDLSNLKLKCMAIGSLPYDDSKMAMDTVSANFKEIPFWPQLVHVSRNEDMILQYLEKIPGLETNPETGAIYVNSESDEFYAGLEELFMNYEEIIENPDSELLDLYEISEKNTSTFRKFLRILDETKPEFAKGQITGAFTLATSVKDKNGRCAFYDETLKEVFIKVLTLKALWQIKQIKKVSPKTTPIIFMDEPSLSQLGTSAFITITKEDVVEIIKGISDVIQANGALSAIHCCGKCDWDAPIQTGINIINLDGYSFSQNLSLFSASVKSFLQRNGFIAWGLVPTLDEEALKSANIEVLIQKFKEAVQYLEDKGIDRNLIISHSMVTPSCGAGGLSTELAEKAMNLTTELSQVLTERYCI
jgi:hypothetical protein